MLARRPAPTDATRPCLAVVAAVVIAAGCAGSDSPPLPPFPDVGRCAEGSERPLRVQGTVDVLRDHGFPIARRETMCAEGEAARLSTPPEEQDWLSCIVLTEPREEGDAPLVVGAVDLSRPELEPVQREAGNVHCSLLVEASQAGPIGRLDATFAELERVVRR